MNQVSQEYLEKARRLLLLEQSATSLHLDSATAPARVYEKLHSSISAILGPASVQLLLVRSALLTKGDFSPIAEIQISDRPAQLLAILQSKAPAVSAESAALLFGTFLALLSKFIGDRLTTEALGRAWPETGAHSPKETNS